MSDLERSKALPYRWGWMLAISLLSSCSAVEAEEPLQAIDLQAPTPNLVTSDSAEVFVTPTVVPTASLTIVVPTMTADTELFVDGVVNIPPSLMLHSAYMSETESLANELFNQGYTGITYKDYYERLKNDTLPGKPILISIDDLSSSWLRDDFRQMIDILANGGYLGTLGIVTNGTRDESDPELWSYYKDLADRGWELAIHGEDHVLLPWQTDVELRRQIEEPYQEILLNTGYRPETLILPFGVMEGPEGQVDERIFKVSEELGIRWVVGIAGGKGISGDPPYYVGRIGPGKTVETTLMYLKNSFK